MNTRKTLIILVNIGFWAMYLILGMIMLGFYYGNQENVPEAKLEEAFSIFFNFALFPSFLAFYGYYFFLFPKFLKKQKYLQTIMYGLAIALISGTIGAIALEMKFGPDCGIEGEGAFWPVLFFIAFIAMDAGIVALVIRGFFSWFEESKLRQELGQKTEAMELSLLKAQLDPHFLFNTINNIDVLILKDPEVASTYLNKLSEMMRFMLYETKTEEIPLQKELNYIEKYIELQKIRTSNDSYVDFQIKGDPTNKMIAPMLFIPYIENAFKHTTNKKLEKAISVHINVHPNKIQLTCNNKFNKGHALSNGKSNGLGNALIQKRLNLLYPNQHELKVSDSNKTYQVDLVIYDEKI